MVKSIGFKVTGITVLVIVALSGYTLWSIYRIQSEHLRESLEQASTMALEFDLAIRDYVTEELRPRMHELLGEEEFFPEVMSSSYVARAVFEKVRKEFPRYVLKFSTDNPRNPRNLAGPEETIILRQFRENPGESIWAGRIEIGGQQYYGRFRARRAEPPCLRCHGDPGDAPDGLIERYGATAGFGWQSGDVIGMDTVAIPLEGITGPILADARRHTLYLLIALSTCLTAFVVSFRALVVNRLEKITAHMSRAAEQGEYSIIETLEVKGDDEIGLLATSFNLLAGKLRRYYGSLEEEVRLRTMRLESTSERLESEIVKHRGTELALEESEGRFRKTSEFYRTVLDSLPDPVAIVDARSRQIVRVNAVFERFYGREASEVVGRTCHEVMRGSLEVCASPETDCPLENMLGKKGPAKSEHLHCAAGGREIHVEVSTSPVFDESGEIVQAVMVSRDITLWKEAVEAMNSARLAAEGSSRARSQFLANMSHEIRTPLNGIIGMVELAMDAIVDDDQKKIFATVSAEASALLTMIDDVLDFSRIETGKLELESIAFNLHSLVEEVSNSIGSQAEKKGLEMHLYVSPDLPSRVVGDPGRLRQVLLNMGTNALKFTEEGEIFLRVELQEDKGDRATVRFSLKDTGIGISPVKQEEIFESFVQADMSTTRKHGGTGLGLPIALHLTQLMGGRLTVESTEGAGSVFRATATFRKAPEGKPHVTREDLDLRGKRVLIVDDSRTSLSVLKSYLGLWGCVTVEAEDGETALGKMRRAREKGETIDLVITDLHMRGMDGFLLSREIREDSAFKDVPIVLMTSRGSIGDGARCRQIGIKGYLTKPLGQDELRRAMIAVLSRSAGRVDIEGWDLVSRHSLAEESADTPLRILVVEDYPTIQDILLLYLRGDGHDVDLAENGQEAVEAFGRRSYDLVFMDVQMPRMDGFEATRAVRALEKEAEGKDAARRTASGVPIIAITAHTEKEDRDGCLDAGMDDFLPKPVKRADLLNMVRKWTRINGGVTSSGGAAGRRDDVTDPIDIEELTGEFLGREQLLVDALRRFLRDLDDQSVKIRKCLQSGRVKDVAHEAHSIKGAARFLTADSLAEAAMIVEKTVKEERLSETGAALTELEGETRRLRRYVETRFGRH